MTRRFFIAAAALSSAFVGVSAAQESDLLAPFPEMSAPRAVTAGPRDHFLANYFAINAWSPDNRYLLTLETDLKDRLPDGAPCMLGVVDLEDGNRFIPVTTTRCWNFQEAAMAHWLPWGRDMIVFNDVRNGRFSAVVMNWRTKEERHYPFPVSAVSEDGTWALSINYARLFLTRPDYGYAGDGQDPRKGVVFPEDDGLWRVNLRTGEARLIVSCAAVRDMVPKVGPSGMSYICHTVISKDMKRVYFLSRSVEESMEGVKKFKGVNWHTTAFTCNADGTNIRRCFPDGWGSSHFNWKPALSERDARTMIVTCKWQNKVYTHVEFSVGEEEKARQVGGDEMNFDGHCIYSPDGRFISGDGYWDKNFFRHWKMVRLADNAVKSIGDFFVPEPYRDVYCRCDLHPRWRPDGRQIGFNSVHEGSRQVYLIDVRTRGASSVLDELMPVPASVVPATGTVSRDAAANVAVVRGTVSGAPAATADEAYVIDMSRGGVKITAPGPRGERWARVTLDQLVRLSQGRPLPCCRIADWPRLKWRGFMIDTVRNYLPVAAVKDVIDCMSRYKLNLFHWHLTENYAWRLESKRFPELQSERAFLHRHKGKFYTQDEFRDIVDYAWERGIATMPEFDFPGHSLAFRRAFGFETMSDPRVVDVAVALFEELCSLAPKEKMPFVHMGTDEVWKRDVEGVPTKTLELMARAIGDAGRTVVSWVPGESYECAAPHVNMLWTDKVSPDTHHGPYFDAIGMYIEDFDPFELLSVAAYHKAGRWHDAGEKNFGAIFCAWHDGFVGMPYENLLRNQPVFPSCVLFGNAYWRGRDADMPQFRKRLPLADDPLLADAADVERRVIAQRDRALSDLRNPFHFLRQTDMRWRLSKEDGTLVASGVAQATIGPARFKGFSIAATNGAAIAETWIKSPMTQTVGAWIGFTGISRDHGLVHSAPLPDIGEWNRFGAKVELNGEPVAPPKWKRPGLKKGSAIADWTPAWTLYEADEEPFGDQEYFMREPTKIRLCKGWNHVKLTIPNPAAGGKTKHRWIGTFIPVDGTTDHPREVPDLEYASNPPR